MRSKSIAYCLFFLFTFNSSLLFSQTSNETLKILEKTLDRQVRSNILDSQRDHELNMMVLDFKLRNQSHQLQYLYKSYQANLSHFQNYNSSLNKFGLDFSEELANSLPNNTEVKTVQDEISFFNNSNSVIVNFLDKMGSALTYLTRGKVNANQVEEELAIEYYELFHSQKDQQLFEEYTNKIRRQFDSYYTEISKEKRDYMNYGTLFTLLTDSHYQKANEQKALISNITERKRINKKSTELNDQMIKALRSLTKLSEEQLQLLENGSSIENSELKEAFLKLKILVAESKVDSLKVEIEMLNLERSTLN